ncbi:cardiolipin synthase [Blastopirellula marina]|uniref:Cardiolipin synthase n=1 Tax=Blastopirellula marina TaxID=124 RepID=A0A2S8GUU2_9BACT|nr:cardiolipin synthase [Blastopirellula marina]PQO48193.1 cardiolipin synthase [Blastopirellula marina]
MDLESFTTLSIVLAMIHTLGLFTAVDAIMTARTSQGAIAWALLLIFVPYLTLPFYWIFGRSKFKGYVNTRRVRSRNIKDNTQTFRVVDVSVVADFSDRPDLLVLERLADFPYTHSNDIRLLVNGQATFDAIYDAIEEAKEYVMLQTYIFRDDGVGQRFVELLTRKAKEGITVYFLYDEIGSYQLSRTFLNDMRESGIQIHAFHTTRGKGNRFQLNFRNHRKIVVVDGQFAAVGGLNFGDEYMGLSKRFGAWRDTHLAIRGPAVQALQWSFLEDWYWASAETPHVNWDEAPVENAENTAIVVPMGPADTVETCGLFFVHAINSAEKRIWIASPYFVPDKQVICALQLAALRGCDVRIMLPERPDHLLVYLSSFHFIHETAIADRIAFYRYQPGFLHQKVLLVDDKFASVGTANLDNRSFRLNFEIMVAIFSEPFAKSVEEMLLADFEKCRKVDPNEILHRSFWFRLGVSGSRLMSPVQ